MAEAALAIPAGGTGLFPEGTEGVTPPRNPGRNGAFLSDVVVEMGFADATTVEQAVEWGRQSGVSLEQVLISEGVLDEEQLAHAVAERCGVDFVDLDRFDADPQAAKLISRSIANRYGAIPIAFGPEESLILALQDPLHPLAVAEIEVMTKSEARIVVATPRAIREAIGRTWPDGEELAKARPRAVPAVASADAVPPAAEPGVQEAADLEKLTLERDRLAAEQNRLVEELQGAITERDQLASERDQLASERDQLASEQAQRAGDLEGTRAERDGIAAELAQLRKELDGAGAEHDRLVVERGDSSAEQARLAEQLRSATAERDRLLAERDRLEAERARLQKAVESSRPSEEADRIAAERDELVTQRDRLAAERDELVTQRGRLEAERDGLVTQRDRLAAERDGLLAEREAWAKQEKKLRRKLAKSKARARSKGK
ncbi:MAG: hypothetical protein U0R52_00240 [Solirubrobacterales bacterium]